ncbi:hypothetical protein [Pseudomonas sp. RIT-PI-AD]|uniref:hypothetical protein n=1 Tax=Pseudomonas sp. RIT-PI-AD TaxID=3035294 RepID=UPI0021DA4CDF|nr:hypothetical protein [Pseudomonas sp. RIT-PI-AD]
MLELEEPSRETMLEPELSVDPQGIVRLAFPHLGLTLEAPARQIRIAVDTVRRLRPMRVSTAALEGPLWDVLLSFDKANELRRLIGQDEARS